jgi:hypothetical protein
MDWLQELCGLDIPHQFASLSASNLLRWLCDELSLPVPRPFAGNIVVGDLTTAAYLLVAHIDEASFAVTDVHDYTARLFPLHRYVGSDGQVVKLVGIRSDCVKELGEYPLTVDGGSLTCHVRGGIQLGDRAVYCEPAVVAGSLLTAKAIDDRAGAVTALKSASELMQRGVAVAVVLTDGEQHVPEGYFSRNFPHILGALRPDCTIVFLDGIIHDNTDNAMMNPPAGASVVAHSGFGLGYSVPPLLFAHLRDDVVPAACSAGIDVAVSPDYRSRGDDWGMVTNPAGHDHAGFFVCFNAVGATTARRTINIQSVENSVAFTVFAVSALSKHDWRDHA